MSEAAVDGNVACLLYSISSSHFTPQLVCPDPILPFLTSYQASLTSSHLQIPLANIPNIPDPISQHILHSNPHPTTCATAILDITPAPTRPSTGTTAPLPSSTSRRATKHPAPTSPSPPPSPPTPTAPSRIASSRAKGAVGPAAHAARGQTLKDGAPCP